MGKSFKDGARASHRDGKKSSYQEKRATRDDFRDSSVIAPPVKRTIPVDIVPLPPKQPPVPPVITLGDKRTDRTQNDTRLLLSDTFRGDGKIFYIDAVENDRGKALRIAEVSKGKRTIIMVPVCLLAALETSMGKVTPILVNP